MEIPQSVTTMVEEGQPLSPFKDILACIKKEQIPRLISRVHHDSKIFGRDAPDCEVIDLPLLGSFNIVFQILLSDGRKWALKVPGIGTKSRWTKAGASSLESEALTMRHLSRLTLLPIPHVFDHNSTLNNEIGCPYILMEFIDGINGHDVWFDSFSPPEVVEARRENILQSLAKISVEFDDFSFKRCGQLERKDATTFKVSPFEVIDVNAMIRETEEGTHSEPKLPIRTQIGPFSDFNSWITAVLELRRAPSDRYSQGIYKLLKLFLSWIPNTKKSFVKNNILCHPDFDLHNLVVTPDGRIKGLIDWDGVVAAPFPLANRAFPKFLTRDWREIKSSRSSNGLPKIEDVAKYRTRYLDLIDELGDSEDFGPRQTHNSLVIGNLKCAADNPNDTMAVIDTIFHKIAVLIHPQILSQRLGHELLNDVPDSDDDELRMGDEFAIETNSEDEEEEATRREELKKKAKYRYLEKTGTLHGGSFKFAARMRHLLSLADSPGGTDTEATITPGDTEGESSSESDADIEKVNTDDPNWLPPPTFELYNVALALNLNQLNKRRRDMLKEGFLRLFWEKNWDKINGPPVFPTKAR